MNLIRVLRCLVACLFLQSLPGYTEEVPGDNAASNSTASEIDSPADNNIDSEEQVSEDVAEETAESPPIEEPEAANLRNKNLGEAFKSFRPSEEISADNAVPFPVDI